MDFNRPIRVQKGMGEGALLYGVFAPSMVLGVALGVLTQVMVGSIYDGQQQKAAPFSLAVVGSWWFYVGNDKVRAWRNVSRHIKQPNVYVGSRPNRSIL